MSADALVCLTLGHEYQPRRMSIEGGGDALLRLPVISFLVHGSDGWLLIDTGLSETMRDEATARRIYRSRAPELPAGDPLLRALADCGLTPADISTVALSHLHVDHTGGLHHFAGGPPVHVQRRELNFGREEARLEAHAYVRGDYIPGEGPPVAWHPLDGDAELIEGVTALSTPGHTPGHQSFRVETAAGSWILAMDAIDLQDGIDTDVPIGASALPEGITERHASHARLMTLARAPGTVHLLPGHCPRTWPGPAPGVTWLVGGG